MVVFRFEQRDTRALGSITSSLDRPRSQRQHSWRFPQDDYPHCRGFYTRNLPSKSAMNASAPGLGSFVGVGVTLILILISATCAPGSIPPAFLAQQQDLAVRVYCAHWRRTRREQALEGDDVERVITDLEMLYPTAFSACRPDGERPCLSWLDALVQGLDATDISIYRSSARIQARRLYFPRQDSTLTGMSSRMASSAAHHRATTSPA
jgi:hypothetical protein